MRFTWYLCCHFGTTLDDERITDMDPVQKLFMYENWLADQKDKSELAKNHAYLVGSFWNPEAVRNLVDEGNSHSSTDEEYEESIKMVMQAAKEEPKSEETPRRRKRRQLKG